MNDIIPGSFRLCPIILTIFFIMAFRISLPVPIFFFPSPIKEKFSGGKKNFITTEIDGAADVGHVFLKSLGPSPLEKPSKRWEKPPLDWKNTIVANPRTASKTLL